MSRVGYEEGGVQAPSVKLISTTDSHYRDDRHFSLCTTSSLIKQVPSRLLPPHDIASNQFNLPSTRTQLLLGGGDPSKLQTVEGFEVRCIHHPDC